MASASDDLSLFFDAIHNFHHTMIIFDQHILIFNSVVNKPSKTTIIGRLRIIDFYSSEEKEVVRVISIEGALRIPMTYDNIPNRIRHKASKLPKQALD